MSVRRATVSRGVASVATITMVMVAMLAAFVAAGPAAAQEQSSVTGAVTDGGGQSVPGLVIDLFEQTAAGERGQWLGDTRTDAQGDYRFDTDAGCYVLTFIAPEGRTFTNGTRWHQPSACVEAGETTTGIDAKLTGGGNEQGTIVGAVVDGGAQPVAGLVIDLFTASGDGDRGRWLGETRTDAQGDYRFDTNAGCYVLTFIAPEGRTFTNGTRWHQPSACVEAGETTTGIDAKLTGGGNEPPTAGCLGAPALPEPAGNVVRVGTEPELQNAVANATSGTTILIAPGTYNLTATLQIRQDNVTIRGDDDDCRAVVLKGRGMDNADYGGVPHGVFTTSVDAAVQNLTISDVYFHPIALNAGAESPHLYNLRLLDAGEQFIKASSGPAWGQGVDEGLVEYVTMAYTNGTPRTDHGSGLGYTQGVDVHGGSDWIIRRNLFRSFHTPDTDDYLFNPVVLMWRGSRNTIVEDNVFIDVDRAIALGLNDEAEGNGHVGGRVANNMVYLTPGLFSDQRRTSSDAAIIIWDSPGAVVDHNTCVTNGNLNHCIEFRFDTTGSVARNNLVDESISGRGGADFTELNNRMVPAGDHFADAPAGDLRLDTDGAIIDSLRVDRLADTPTDIDGDNRKTRTVAGADEP